ncbi:Mutual gliding-motility protein MglA [bioreactor metagenome]|uniref:Mutual gliding-motility protein MglA n=1 Tax=bioreactor metagenome TaxID=1076179 RepID=A0A644XJG0_9ZZZZ
MHINWQQRELQLKIVYYGPALSGKTTNLEQIYAKVDASHRSELVSLKTHEDRTLYFDYLQLELGKIGNLTPKILLYTVPGQTYYEASRKLVLRGADGVVFVADSQLDRMDANRESWQAMHSHLASFDTPMTNIPIVVQFNKQDLPNALSETVLKAMLHLNGLPVYPAVATDGTGVFETLKAITRSVVTQVQRAMAR